MNKSLNLGVIGAGKIGTLHAKNISLFTDARVLAIADVNRVASENLAKQVSAKKIYSSYFDLIKDNDIDGVIISLPNNMHYEVSMAAIDAGKHVFCEKPLSLNVGEAEDIVKKVKGHDVKFQMGYNRRFDPSYEKVKKLIAEGIIGNIIMANSNTLDPEPHSGWEANETLSGGILFTSCCHDFDLLYWLLGSEVRKICVESAGDFGKDERVLCLLSFKNNVLGIVSTFEACPYGHDVKTEIIGDKAAIRVEKPSATFINILDKKGIHKDYPYWFIERFEESYLREIQDFIKCIIDDEEPRVSAKEGMYVVKVAQAARESQQKGKIISLASM
jgi:myo-inositol 2-dehydrogenase/D-chiro-inositol 1-dehydrogenase